MQASFIYRHSENAWQPIVHPTLPLALAKLAIPTNLRMAHDTTYMTIEYPSQTALTKDLSEAAKYSDVRTKNSEAATASSNLTRFQVQISHSLVITNPKYTSARLTNLLPG